MIPAGLHYLNYKGGRYVLRRRDNLWSRYRMSYTKAIIIHEAEWSGLKGIQSVVNKDYLNCDGKFILSQELLEWS